MSIQELHVFAYGSNLDSKQMRRRCPSARIVSSARLPGHRLAFTRYSTNWSGGVADVVPDPESEVWGLVWRIASNEIEILDRYEIVPTGYVRRLLPIATPGGVRRTAWTYQVARKATHVPPPTRYVDILLRACDDHGFPLSHRRAIEAAVGGST
ncbi:MAG: gamma-glutamylcyclotransferase family protein [Thermoanaerobaculia bacterium]|nr:gamma-glutamylcyclotransferase family protein [Thermoanaerobaculia bacterium]